MDNTPKHDLRTPQAGQTPEGVAEELISAWRNDPAEHTYDLRIDFRSRFGAETTPLNLSGLGLTHVPLSVRQLRDLEILELHGNQLHELPRWIGELSALKALVVSENQIATLPEEIGWLRELVHLDVENNQLESLPDTLRDLPLEDFHLSGNPRLRLPEGLLNLAPPEILRYYYESREEQGKPLLELKLLLGGRGRSGKTTLVKRLAGEQPDRNEAETHSIGIRELTLSCPHGQVRTRAWDFGGQEILHATHQFFLTERSLYLLVLEPRSGLAQRDAEYWLKLIETQGGRSPVIVAMNWSHGRHWRVDEVKLRRKFPFIVDFVSTDALYGEGIEGLRATLLNAIEERMRDVWLPFPKRWREIKHAVAGMHENFLTYSQYAALCARCGEKDPEAQADLAGILHALGLALYFGKDPRLHDTRVLNPTWVTGGVYAVIRAPLVAEQDGQLSVEDMPRVLREAEAENVVRVVDYPPETHGFILELMRAFQLCYTSQEQDGQPARYLVPELLPEFEPEMKEPWDSAPVRLRYRYEVLPPGLLPRFIVRTHALSDGSPHWRHGVVLRHADAQALVRAESDRTEIQVFVLGNDEETRTVLVTMVRRELHFLHNELKMHPVEDLELSGGQDRWISVKALCEVEEPKMPTQKLAVQPEGTAEVDIPTELDKLLPAEARAIDRDPNANPVPVRLFVSYAHDDERQLRRLDAMLDVLEQYHGLASWRDRRLIAGQEWDREIRGRLEQMEIFLFIASQSSLVRPYIKDPELRRARERYLERQIEIVAVKLEPCACDEDPFLGTLQRLAGKYKSIAESPLKSAAWECVRRDLLPVIRRVREKKAAKRRGPRRGGAGVR